MISIIITAFKEPRTIQRSILALATQVSMIDDIIVVAPDNETLDEASKLSSRFKNLRMIKDSGNGKSAALNLAISRSRGEILVLTDGDVYVKENSVRFMIEKFRDKRVGAVSGRPVSIDSKKKMLGFWSHVLTDIADDRRRKALRNKKRFFCSGYFFAIKKELMPRLPEGLLSEDGFISHIVYKKGYKIEYSPESLVYVKYPSNFTDWIKQKKRSAGGYNQIKKLINVEIRSFKSESFGAIGLLKYASNMKELFWIFSLFIARIYLWILVYRDVNFRRKNREELWERVESTK